MQFRGTGSRTQWEFQYAFSDTTLTYALRPSGFEGELYCGLTIVNAQADTVRDQWLASGKAKLSSPTHKQYYTGCRTLELEPGVWQVKLLVRDMNDSTRILRSSFTTTVRNFGLTVSLSDVMYTLPHAAGAAQNFNRNGVDAAPNPRAEMVGADPSISVYMECYNALANHVDTMIIKYEVLDYTRQEMMTSYVKRSGSSNGIVLREDIPAGALRTGVYTLIVSILSKSLESTLATQEKRFYILNPELPPFGDVLVTDEERFLTSEWADCTGDRLKLEIDLSNVIATRAEQITLDGLHDERAKQRYLFRFWQSRDPDPSTPQNERLDDFRKMKARADAFFRPNTKRDGWRTDRGRVLLKYGVPTQTIQHIQDRDARPYDEWFYQNIQGGVYFYFVDMHLLQDHKLVHSTMVGEIRNENWFDMYAKAFSPDPNPTQTLQPNNR